MKFQTGRRVATALFASSTLILGMATAPTSSVQGIAAEKREVSEAQHTLQRQQIGQWLAVRDVLTPERCNKLNQVRPLLRAQADALPWWISDAQTARVGLRAWGWVCPGIRSCTRTCTCGNLTSVKSGRKNSDTS